MLTLYCMTHKVVEDRRIPKDRTMMLVGAYNKDIDRSDYIKDDLSKRKNDMVKPHDVLRQQLSNM